MTTPTKKDSIEARKIRSDIYEIILGLNYAIQLNNEYISDLKTEIKDLSKVTRASERRLKKLIGRYAELTGTTPDKISRPIIK